MENETREMSHGEERNGEPGRRNVTLQWAVGRLILAAHLCGPTIGATHVVARSVAASTRPSLFSVGPQL